MWNLKCKSWKLSNIHSSLVIELSAWVCKGIFEDKVIICKMGNHRSEIYNFARWVRRLDKKRSNSSSYILTSLIKFVLTNLGKVLFINDIVWKLTPIWPTFLILLSLLVQRNALKTLETTSFMDETKLIFYTMDKKSYLLFKVVTVIVLNSRRFEQQVSKKL